MDASCAHAVVKVEVLVLDGGAGGSQLVLDVEVWEVSCHASYFCAPSCGACLWCCC